MRYIDADKLLDEVQTERGCIDFSMTATDIRKMIREQPTADVRENVRGEWQPHPNKNFKEWDVCSACRIGCKRREYGFNDDGREWMTEYNFNFCPNCGAKMEVEHD